MKKKPKKPNQSFFLYNYKTRELEQIPRCFQSFSHRKLNINRNLNLMPTTKNRVPFVTNIMTCSNMPTHSSKYVVWAAHNDVVSSRLVYIYFYRFFIVSHLLRKTMTGIIFRIPPPPSLPSKNPSKPDSFFFLYLQPSRQVAIHMRIQFSRCGNLTIQN